ncbi:kelch-like protein 17 isoform X2 [Onthophagus taurus]|uniref:kelch-like protein 17 isoform X2 n=1 Tax=Onthophagus taurus TaxID=166361 RepID=UPI0039BEBEA6
METQKIYKKQEVIVEIFQRLSAMRDKLCDITLVVDDVKIHAHKVVLAACSEFMKTLLTGDFKEYQQPTIKLSEINAEAANQVVNYMYGSSIKITIDNVFNILRISRMWFINTLLEECEQFLMKSLNISNALLIWTNFRLLDQNQIKTRAEDLLGCHFTDIMNSDKFMELEIEELIELLSKDSLLIKAESQVFECAISWIKHDQERRKVYIADIIECVRMSLIPRTYLNDCLLQNELIKNNHELIYKIYSQFASEAKPRMARNVLFVMGKSPQNQCSVEYYNFNTDTWHKMPTITESHNQISFSYIKDVLYVVYNKSAGSDLVIAKYNLIRGMLFDHKTLTNLKTSFEEVIILNNFIYIFSTRNRNGYSAVPEKVDLITGTITSITSMNIARRDVALCGLDNFIYAIGGTDGNQALKYAERYNIHTNVWERLSDMNYPRKRAVAASVKGLLYVFGDLNNVGGAFNTISVYDPENKLWTDIPSEISFCCTEPLSITSDENMIYVFGKDNALGSGTNRVAVFNPETKTWNKDLIKSSISLTKTIYGAAFMKNFKSS